MEIPPSCCHAALLLNVASDWITLTPLSLDQNTAREKKKTTLGEARTLGKRLLTPPPIVPPQALAIVKHLVYQTPTEGGRVQGVEGERKKSERK